MPFRLSPWVLLVAICLAGIRAATQAGDPMLRIVQPTPQTVVSGPVSLEVEVTPASVSVRAVTFFVDGRQACSVIARPFVCEWNVTGVAAPRSIRVTADLLDGRRLVQTLRTAPRAIVTVIHGSAQMVLVPVHVTDQRGEFVRGLTADDFRVHEDGVVQRAELVKAGENPASVFLALDMSESMQPAVDELRQAATGFLRALRADDAVTVGVFNEGLRVLLRPGAETSARLAALDRLSPAGGTALYDSLIRAVDLIKSQATPRAIVVFTDGDDSWSRSSVNSVRTALQTNDVVLYVVGQSRGGGEMLREVLSPLASETGGAAWFGTRMSQLRGHFAEIVADLRNQYTLAYAPARPIAEGGWRRISVTLASDRGYRVRSREGYLPTSDARVR